MSSSRRNALWSEVDEIFAECVERALERAALRRFENRWCRECNKPIPPEVRLPALCCSRACGRKAELRNQFLGEVRRKFFRGEKLSAEIEDMVLVLRDYRAKLRNGSISDRLSRPARARGESR